MISTSPSTISYCKSLGSLPLTVQPTESQVPRISFIVPASSFGHGSVPHNLGDLDDVIKLCLKRWWSVRELR
ncbi:hypothetical protein EV1_046790 [Malus domestica]